MPPNKKTETIRRMDSMDNLQRKNSGRNLRRMDTTCADLHGIAGRKKRPTRQEIIEQRRLRNIQSAQRSRDRLKNEPKWMQVQMSENEDRMRYLEKQVIELTEELSKTKDKRNTGRPKGRDSYQESDRPAWFGDPF